MEIISIFDNNLFAIKYPGEKEDEFQRLFNLWHDLEYLEEFYEKNKNDLGYFKTDVEQAILKTIDEAGKFRKAILKRCENNPNNLEELFEDLSPKETIFVELIKKKSKQQWLRIYAIKIDDATFLVTGGAIKLTQTMNERTHTMRELEKLEKCKEFLKRNGVFDDNSFYEMINEQL